MTTSRATIVCFHLPEEYTAAYNFEINNDMKLWEKNEDTQWITFQKVEFYTSTEVGT